MNFISAGNQAVVVALSSTVDVVKATAETITATTEAVKDFANAGKAYANAVRVNTERKAAYDIQHSENTLYIYSQGKEAEAREQLRLIREADAATREKARAKNLDIRLPHEIREEEAQIEIE